MKVVTAEEMRQIDRRAADAGLTTDILMENAGRAVAEETMKLAAGVTGKRILVLVGPGNNGGDGLVAARLFTDSGADVTIYLCSRRPERDKNLELVRQRELNIGSVDDDTGFSRLEGLLGAADIVVDSVFGTGRSRALDGVFKEVMTRIIAAKKKKPQALMVAVDIPSGLDSDTGAVDPSCATFDATITLGYPKPGLFNFPGADKAGKVIIADIGLPTSMGDNIRTELITGEWVQSVLPERPASANKGTFGKVLIVAGSINYIGAAYLACMGAARVGAGLVTLSIASSLQPILAAKLTEVTYAPLPESVSGIIASKASAIVKQLLPGYDVLLMGCGLGQKLAIANFVKSVIFDRGKRKPPALILDADALNILAKVPNWWQKLSEDVILTPHSGEMARLSGFGIDEVQRRRLEIARKMAAQWQKVVVLKGAYTIIAASDGRVRINPSANPGLASAGTGDVLSGVIAGLAAQGLSPFDAAACGVYIHAQAGEVVRTELGDAGMLAGDLLPVLPRVIKGLKQE